VELAELSAFCERVRAGWTEATLAARQEIRRVEGDGPGGLLRLDLLLTPPDQ
jgi:hypothetical protein